MKSGIPRLPIQAIASRVSLNRTDIASPMNLEQFVLSHDPISRLGIFTPIAFGAVLIEWDHTPNSLRIPLEPK